MLMLDGGGGKKVYPRAMDDAEMKTSRSGVFCMGENPPGGGGGLRCFFTSGVYVRDRE